MYLVSGFSESDFLQLPLVVSSRNCGKFEQGKITRTQAFLSHSDVLHSCRAVINGLRCILWAITTNGYCKWILQWTNVKCKNKIFFLPALLYLLFPGVILWSNCNSVLHIQGVEVFNTGWIEIFTLFTFYFQFITVCLAETKNVFYGSTVRSSSLQKLWFQLCINTWIWSENDNWWYAELTFLSNLRFLPHLWLSVFIKSDAWTANGFRWCLWIQPWCQFVHVEQQAFRSAAESMCSANANVLLSACQAVVNNAATNKS